MPFHFTTEDFISSQKNTSVRNPRLPAILEPSTLPCCFSLSLLHWPTSLQQPSLSALSRLHGHQWSRVTDPHIKHVTTVVVLSQRQAAIMKSDWLPPHPQNWQTGSVAPPPPIPPCCAFKQPYSLTTECWRQLNVQTAQVPGQAVCLHRAVWTVPQCSDGWMRNKLQLRR